ncbi:cytokinin oxidase [Legionella birminghamensis]|uniref:Cytokinin oxidase n=1 Tax=Legionella birminghamensis TaxID=28083 RepID=A0A378I7K3_9GAMM|nr:FAD-binding oxidoreductase [Legionella birminghamensis]KTC73792.1 cytokinin oxidase [Legionella birminghamensis]STX30710.1 cytokinin oxidase [Legionella birminghamensis]
MRIFYQVAAIFLSLMMLSNQAQPSGTLLNDIHSSLNPTLHSQIIHPVSITEIQNAVHTARQYGQSISISGGKHSMGGQQFGSGTIHLSMSKFNKVIGLDSANGIVEVQSGIEWPQLVAWLQKNQPNPPLWGIRQKQTGADNLSIGGALSSNVHGRGLNMHPIIADVESFTLIDANGDLLECSRRQNPELFKLVIGGYGLFGVIATVKLRLSPVTTLQREVKLITVDQFIPLVTKKINEDYLYGDFQFAIDPASGDFMKKGIYSLYRPVDTEFNPEKSQKELSSQDWTKLLLLAHKNKTAAFTIYSKYYLGTNGQIYRSDTHQMGFYLNNYHQFIDKNSSEMISEIYVPRDQLSSLFTELREDFRQHKVNMIYGTIRLIKKDSESYLPWAKQDYACIVFNFHVEHTTEGISKAKEDFRLIIDRALQHNGSYFLTYHRWARQDQVIGAYPQFIEFLKLKKKYDPEEVFQSDWYRHYRKMFNLDNNAI